MLIYSISTGELTNLDGGVTSKICDGYSRRIPVCVGTSCTATSTESAEYFGAYSLNNGKTWAFTSIPELLGAGAAHFAARGLPRRRAPRRHRDRSEAPLQLPHRQSEHPVTRTCYTDAKEMPK